MISMLMVRGQADFLLDMQSKQDEDPLMTDHWISFGWLPENTCLKVEENSALRGDYKLDVELYFYGLQGENGQLSID